jgi:hypothetical protein
MIWSKKKCTLCGEIKVCLGTAEWDGEIEEFYVYPVCGDCIQATYEEVKVLDEGRQ